MRISDWSSDVCSSDLFSRLFGAGEEFEELGHAFVDFGALLGKHPQRSAADNGVLRRALDVGVVGQGRCAEREFARLDDVGAVAAGTGERSEEHTSELQSLMRISYDVFCLNKKKRLYTTK